MISHVVAAVLLAATADPLSAGSALFDAGDFQGALKLARQAVANEPDRARRAQLELLEARCTLALRQQLDVEAALGAALADDPTATVDASVSPALAATLDRLRVELAADVSIDSSPPGLGVLLDGALVGKAPLVERLSVGAHRVAAVDGSGARGPEHTLRVAPRQPQTVRLELQPQLPQPVPPPSTAVEVHNEATGLVPAAAVHGVVDFNGSAVFEAGAALLGTHWLAEVDGIAAAVPGVTARAGLRFDVWRDLVAVQATAEGVLFFSTTLAPGGGGSAGLVVHPWSWLDLFALGGASFVRGTVRGKDAFRTSYALLDFGARLRWPVGGEP